MSDPQPSGTSTSASAAQSLSRELEVRLADARLSRNDERILAFLREHLDELAFQTSESIGQGAGVSRAAVVRFARRLGYDGFSALRDRHRAELQATSNGTAQAPGEQSPTLLQRKVARDRENLAVLPVLLDAPLEDAARRAARARVLWLLGNRETYGLVAYLYRLLHHVRANVRLVDPSFPDPLRDMEASDVLLACTFRPYARQTLTLVGHARRRNAEIILLTDSGHQRFHEDADVALVVPVESPTMFLSFVAATSVLETFAALVARIDADVTYETLHATGAFVDEQRLMIEPSSAPGQRPSERRRG